MRQLANYLLKFGKIGCLSLISLFLFLVTDVHADTTGQITSIDSAGYVYINLTSRDGIEEGDSIDIYEGSTKILTLPVRAVYSDQSQLEAPSRRDLSKLSVGLMVVAHLKEEILATQGKVISFDSKRGSGFINLGIDAGIEEVSVFEVFKDDKVVANLQVTVAYNKTSKVLLIDKEPPKVNLEDLEVRLKKEKAISEGLMKKLWRNLTDKVSGQSKSMYTIYDIDGNRSQSFYINGDNYREELDLRYSDKIDNKRLEGYISGRWTDDWYVDRQRYSIEDLYFQMQDEKLTARAGNVLGNFTNYSLIASLKGLRSDYNSSNTLGDWKLYSIFGVNKAYWEDLWSELDNEVYTRYVGGLRFAQDFSEDFTVGINMVSSDDDKDGSASSSTIPQDNKVISIDSVIKLFSDMLGIKTELATSFIKFNESRADEPFKNDLAFDFNTDFDWEKWHFDNDYERVGTNFRSISGVASTDREEFSHRIEYKHSDEFSGNIGYRNFHNNLKNHSSKTTFTDVYESNLSANPFDKLPDIAAVLGFELRKITTSDTSSDSSTATHSLDLSNTTGDYRYGFGYSLVRKLDDVTLSNSRRKHIWEIFLNSRYQFNDIRISPDISYSIERDKQCTSKDVDVYQTIRGGFSIFLGRYTSVNFSYSHTDTDYEVSGRDQVRNLPNFKLRHCLFKNLDKVLEVSFKQNDFIREDDSISFTENILEISYTQKF